MDFLFYAWSSYPGIAVGIATFCRILLLTGARTDKDEENLSTIGIFVKGAAIGSVSGIAWPVVAPILFGRDLLTVMRQ